VGVRIPPLAHPSDQGVRLSPPLPYRGLAAFCRRIVNGTCRLLVAVAQNPPRHRVGCLGVQTGQHVARRDAFGQVGDNGDVAREIAPPHGISKRRMQHSWIFRMLFGASRPRPSRLPASSSARWECRELSRCGRPGGPLGHRPSRQAGGPAHSARLPRRSCLAKHYVVVSPDWSGVCAGWPRSCSSLLWMSSSVATMNA
jgi:hypothetical protein